jgi:ribonuclease R
MSKLPSNSELRAWITEHPGESAKRDIARAFGIKGAARIDLKRQLKELEDEGFLQKRHKSYRDPERLPPVSILRVQAPDASGDLYARAVDWASDAPEPRILVTLRAGDPAVGEGSRILAKLFAVQADDHQYEARLIRVIGANPQRILGVFREGAEGGRIVPIDKGMDKEWMVAPGMTLGAVDGELIEAEQAGPARLGLPRARIVDRLGDPSAPKAVSLIAIHQHGIPDHFPDAVIHEADACTPTEIGKRVDLTGIDLLTIDPWDARDHDDAIYAEADTYPSNSGGFIVWVAIADVAHYVTPGSELDREARKRGNSTYFPDRVVPMLPDRLSGDLCSLHEGVVRPCITLRMVLNAEGQKISHEFMRAMMRSAASLTYEQAQAADEGRLDDATTPLAPMLGVLFAAYRATTKARAKRQPLEIDLPERQIILAADGRVSSVAFKERLDAHRLVEEFMVLANVSAAEELIKRKTDLLFRAHEEPSPEKLNALRELAVASGFTLAKGQVLQTRHLNQLLDQAEGTEFDELINISTLRAMTQAYYSPDNFGHFGLALRNYAHFTSPIRRYADLVVHRALIAAHGWGKDGLTAWEIENLSETAKQISETERRSMKAERETTDRYLAAFLSERVGHEFGGRISGVTRFGIFVKLDGTGADGLVPIRSLGDEFFHHDAEAQTLTGDRSGRIIGLGQRVSVKLAEATPITGGLLLELLELDGTTMPRVSTSSRGKGRYQPRSPGKVQAGKAKAKRKVDRKRS